MRFIIFMFATISFIFANRVDYKEFEAEVLSSSPILKSNALELESANLESSLLLRIQNPMAEVEISEFNQNSSLNKKGWRIGLSQELRLPSYAKDLKSYSSQLINRTEKSYLKKKVSLIALLRINYSSYVKEVKKKELIKEEIELVKKLEKIAQDRFESGAGTKAAVLQAYLQKISAQTKLLEQKERVLQSYYKLLEVALVKDVTLNTDFLYDPIANAAKKSISNVEIDEKKAEANLLKLKAKTEDRVLKKLNLFGEYEKEPEQSAFRIGLESRLPLYNLNKEEYRLTKLKSKQSELELKALIKAHSIEIDSLEKKIEALSLRIKSLKLQQQSAQKLLDLFEEGYKASQSSLLDLIETKNSLIDTKMKILEATYLANIYIIRINYLQGELK